jgi:hypothetical protein
MAATFLHHSDGRLRGLRLAAFIYLFNALITLVGEGWRSLSWVAWLLLAVGFLAVAPAEEHSPAGQSKWRSPRHVTGVAMMFLGVGLLFYRFVPHF